MKIGSRDFPSGTRTYVMGILNVTPDSFSDGGSYAELEAALAQAEKMITSGADIIDIGGESTRPGYQAVDTGEEIHRVVPVIEAIKSKWEIPVSIDTYKSEVARAALQAGADMLNDIWGFRADEEMAALAQEWNVPVCLMHNRDNTDYQDVMTEVIGELNQSIAIAKRYGVREDHIILDPGIGFGKTWEQNLMVCNHLEEIAAMGYPVLLGVSRKSVIGKTLDLPVSEREEGTIAANVAGIMKGCEYIRVHDVEKNVRAAKMADAIKHVGKV